VISQILRKDDSAGRGLLRYIADGYVPAFTVFTLFELRRRPEIFDAFLEFFDECPCILLKGYDELFEAELAAYPEPSAVDPVVMGFSRFNRDKGTSLRGLIERAFLDPPTLAREAEWPRLKDELLAGWLEIKPNFQPRSGGHTGSDGVEFVELASWEQIARRALEWFRRQHDRGVIVDSHAFPSVRMTLWTVYFRIYIAQNRVPEPQDVFDALISTSAPYLDAVVTENFQADIYRQAQKHDPCLKHLEVLTLKDFRSYE
jgi:hypothetical protein